MNLNSFFNPQSIAIVGASHNKEKLGYTILDNIIKAGFTGKVIPVNPKGGKINNLKVINDFNDYSGKIDLALIVIPGKFVNTVIEEGAKKGIKNFIIISAGFKEIGGEGIKRESQLKKLIEKYNLSVLGPNCLGLLDSIINLNASFAPSMIEEGNIAFISQSGAICTAVLDWAKLKGIGFSRFISLGNKAGITENELIDFFNNDSKTTAVFAYLEEISQGAEFIKAAKKLSLKKPLVIIKSGKTTAGQKAISSHTGSLAGEDKIIQAAFDQAGVIRANDLRQCFNLIEIMQQPLPKKLDKVVVVTNAGGPGVMIIDALESSQLKLAKLSSKTNNLLKKLLPAEAGLVNPIDIIGDAKADRYDTALKAVLSDNNVDSAVVLLTPQTVTEIKETAKLIDKNYKKYKKPIYSSFIGGYKVKEGTDYLSSKNLPYFNYPEEVIETLEKISVFKKNQQKQPLFSLSILEVKKKQIRILLEKAKKHKLPQLSFLDCLKILDIYGIPVIKSVLAKNAKQAGDMAKKLAGPFVLKAVAPKLIHKTDVGGVMVNVAKENLVSSYNQIKNKLNKKSVQLDGVIIQPMISSGQEVILGIKQDPSFGSVIAFGLGGIFVEVLKDISFRIAPLSQKDATEMIENLQSYSLLKGVRGQKGANLKLIENAILRLGQLGLDFPEIKEMDINPAFVDEKGLVVVDVRILI